MGLDYPEEWHDFVSEVQDGSQAAQDNYVCWLLHYYNKHVLGCLDAPNCPGSDPWDESHF
jgi:hypothetical protein